MTAPHRTYLLFSSVDRTMAIPVDQIEEVVPAFEIRSTPGLTGNIVGLINFRGGVLPVLDCRRLVSGESSELQLQHNFIITHTEKHQVALLIEEIGDLVHFDTELEQGDHVLAVSDCSFRTVIMHGGEMVFVLDVDACFSGMPPQDAAPAAFESITEGGYVHER
ncbi:chemotaxis protein CheW [bacterium]|nr:chemotaxis protein CheW [bacterium]